MIGDRATSGTVDLFDDQDLVTGIPNLEIVGKRGFLDEFSPFHQWLVTFDSRRSGNLAIGGATDALNAQPRDQPESQQQDQSAGSNH